MSFTQIWTAFLASIATLAIAVLWVFSHGQGDALVKSEGDALRAVANASLAALESEISHSSATEGATFSRNPDLQTLARKASQSRSPGRFAKSFRDLAYQGPLGQHPDLSMALVDPWGDLLAEAGLANEELKALGKSTGRQDNQAEQTQPKPALAMLQGKPFVFSIQAITGSTLRLLSLVPLKARGDGPVRRTLGTAYPAALIHDSQVALEFSGSGSIATVLPTIPTQRALSQTGISDYEMVGQGADRRLAVWGSLASSSSMAHTRIALLVLSTGNAGYNGERLWVRFSNAWAQTPHSTRGMLLLFALWVTALGISLMLPRVEWIHPIARLTAALDEPDLRASNERLSKGAWSSHFEPLLAALGRRVLRNSTQRSWQISGANTTARPSAKVPVIRQEPLTVTQEAPVVDDQPTASNEIAA